MFNTVGFLAKPLSVIGVAAVLSGCSVVGEPGTPYQLRQAMAVHSFDENRAPFGQRIVEASAVHKPRVYGLNPYFGR